MNVAALMDAVVRQTTVLLAHLATASSGRAQLANTANQVFLNLVLELKQQGLSSKVIADMFGLALRTYQERVRRVSESKTVRGRSLWEAVFEHIERHGPLPRAEVLARFSYDDPMSVRGVLNDLVQSGSVYRTGRGDSVTYRKADASDFGRSPAQAFEAHVNLVWIAAQRLGRSDRAELQAALNIGMKELDLALDAALTRGHLRRVPASDSDPERFESTGCVLPYDDPKGWEAALFDHYQALVLAISLKLESGQHRARRDDVVGGSTFGLSVWPGHPFYDDALGLLKTMRALGSELREKIDRHNAEHDVPSELKTKVVAYMGQYVVEAPAQSAQEEQ